MMAARLLVNCSAKWIKQFTKRLDGLTGFWNRTLCSERVEEYSVYYSLLLGACSMISALRMLC